jgi:hypothetical protein
MRLYQPSEVSFGKTEIICRQTRLLTTVMYLFFVSVLVGSPVLWRHVGAPWIAWGGIAALAVLVAPSILFGTIPALWRRSNWLLAVQPDGLWVNLRTYGNDHFAEGQTVVWFDLAEISAARTHVERCTTPSGGEPGGTTQRRTTHLQLELAHADTEQLQDALSVERKRKPAARTVLGFIPISNKLCHYPVTLPEPNVVRIAWRGSTDHVVPSINYLLQETTMRQKSAEAVADQFGDWRTMDDAAFDVLVRHLVASGDRITATNLLKGRLGITYTAAHEQVEGIEKAVNAKQPG